MKIYSQYRLFNVCENIERLRLLDDNGMFAIDEEKNRVEIGERFSKRSRRLY